MENIIEDRVRLYSLVMYNVSGIQAEEKGV